MKLPFVSAPLDVAKALIAFAMVLAITLCGGRGELASSLIQLTVFASYFAWAINIFKDSFPLAHLYRPLGAVLIIFVLFLFYCLGQCLGGSGTLASLRLGSVYPFRSYEFVVHLTMCLLLFLVCMRLSVHRKIVDSAAMFVVGIVFFVSVSGMLQKLSGPQNPIFWQKYMEVGKGFGPFINGNDFGALLALSFPWMLALLHYRCVCVQRILTEQPQEKKQKSIWVKMISLGTEQGVTFILLLVFLSVGACLVATARSALVIILVSTLIYFIFQGRAFQKIRFFIGFVLVAGLIAAAFYYFTDAAIMDQYQILNLKKDFLTRFEIASQSLRLFEKFPWFGVGLGGYTFISNWVVHFTGSTYWFIHADNDYVELLTDTGLVGFALFMLSLGGLILRLIFKKNESRSLWKRLMHYQASIAVLSIALLEIHSFCLRTPAIAILFIFQLAILYATSLPSLEKETQGEAQNHFFGRRNVMASLCLIGVCIISIVPARALIAEGYRLHSNRLFGLEQAVQWQASNADYWFQLAVESEKMGRQLNQQSLKMKSVKAMDQAIALAPTHAHYWFVRGLFQMRAGMRDAGIESLKKAIFWAPNFYRYHFYLLSIYLNESARAWNASDRQKWSSEARLLDEQISKLPYPPQPWQARERMGKPFYALLEKQRLAWGESQVR